MFAQIAERDIFKFTRAVRNQKHLLRLFQKNRTETWNLQLELLETIMPEQFLPIWQKQEEENILQI